MNKVKINGYTLVELLVGLTVIFAIGSIVFAIFISTLRGTNKSASLEAIRQNGSAATNQITRAVRNAKVFDGVSLDGTGNFSVSCVMSNGPTPPFTRYKGLSVTTFEDTVEVYRCPVDAETAIFKNNQPITDSAVVTVDAESCYFTCIQTTSTSVPVVGINFLLRTKNQTGSPDFDSQETFSTTVSPRNFVR